MARPSVSALITAALFASFAPICALAQAPQPAPVVSLGNPQPPADQKSGVTVTPMEQSAIPEKSASSDSRQRTPLSAFWDNGLFFESESGQFHLHVGGSAQIDSTWFIGPQSVFLLPDGSANGVNNASATILRRARLRADGDLFSLFDFVVEYDFASASEDHSDDQPLSFSSLTGTPSPAAVWLQIRDVPCLGYVRIGYQTKPIGMINNTSANNLPFMERPDNSDAFYAPFDNGSTLGISVRNWIESERLAWVFGLYRPSTNVFGVTLNKYAYGARVTGTPVYEAEGERLIHLGLGFFGSQLPEDELRVRARPLLRNGPGFAVPVLVDTGELPGNSQYTIGPEFALVNGPFTFRAEWAGQIFTDAVVNGAPQGTVFYHGGYVEALCFLTGEHQDYNKRDGVFGRVVPLNDYSLRKGDTHFCLGALQVGARFSYLDLNDMPIQGGMIYDGTFGVNWFLTPNIRFQANYIVEHREGPTGTPTGWFSGIGLRAAIDF